MRRARALVRELERDVVEVAPVPVLAGLVRLDDRMGGLVEVPGRVLSGRVVAAPDVAARGAAPQVKPHASGQEALHAAIAAGCDRSDLVEMGADVGHVCSLAEASRGEYSRDTARVEELLSLARDFPRRSLEM